MHDLGDLVAGTAQGSPTVTGGFRSIFFSNLRNLHCIIILFTVVLHTELSATTDFSFLSCNRLIDHTILQNKQILHLLLSKETRLQTLCRQHR